MIHRLMIARQDDPNATVGYDSDEDVDGLRAAHPPEPCGECSNGACWDDDVMVLRKFYCFRVIVDDDDDYEEESWWPKWDMESCPFELADR